MTQDTIVGIDLGTTNSAIAVVGENGIDIIPVHGAPTMPSAVGIDPAGKLLIGQAAKNQAVSAPENTILSIKRLMGTEETVTLGGRAYRPEEISALILGELKRAAEARLGHPVTRAVITVPAFFNERQRQATQDAGKLAGLEVLRIINEPTAAALAYGAGTTGEHQNETLLVYDLGGGTFDVSVVSVENGVVEVRSSHGDTHLGGDDFDAALAKLAEDRFEETDRGASGGLSDSARRRLRAVMEGVKISLSDDPFAAVREEFLTPTAHLVTEVSRDEYERLIEPWIEKTLECLQRALADAGLSAAQVDRVMLVGGATRTPLVQQVLHARLGKPPRHEINPDLIVAMGAAIQGAALAGKPAPAILVDITAHSFGIKALRSLGGFLPDLACVPIIRRGTPLPSRKSEQFTTWNDNQQVVEIEVFQGESDVPENNLLLGTFLVEGLAKVPAGNVVVVEFSIDLNGLLHVSATEKSTGLNKSVTIDTGGHHRINLDAARANLAAILDEETEPDDGDPDDMSGEPFEMEIRPAGQPGGEAPPGLLAGAKNLRKRAEELLAKGVPESDAAGIRELLEASSAAIANRDWPALKDSDDRLSDILFYLED